MPTTRCSAVAGTTAWSILHARYAEAHPTVIWLLPNVGVEDRGAVSLQVRVNENARAGDYRVDNQGSVQVGNDDLALTDEIHYARSVPGAD